MDGYARSLEFPVVLFDGQQPPSPRAWAYGTVWNDTPHVLRLSAEEAAQLGLSSHQSVYVLHPIGGGGLL